MTNIVTVYNQKSKTESKYQTAQHAKEWIEGSGVSKAITRLGPESLTDRTEIAKRLGWKLYSENLPLGWYLSGLNLATMKPETKFGQFKPDTPIQLEAEDEKPSKYITPKKSVCNYDAIALQHPDGPDYWQKILDDPSLPIAPTEGGKKGGALMTCDFAALALAGVDMGLIKGKLVNNLDVLAVQGRPFYLTFDSDILTKKEVQLALKKLATALRQKGCIIHVVTWLPELGKGIDDVLANHGPEKIKEIMNSAIPYSEWLKSLETQFKGQDNGGGSGKKKGKDIPSADAMGRAIAEDYRNRLAFNNEVLCWYRYEADAPGVWSPETEEYIESIVFQILKSKGIADFAPSYVSNAVKIARHELIERKWIEQPGLLPFENGALEIATGKLLPHAPGYKFCWSLPRKHDPMAENWGGISEWLDSSTAGNEHLRNVLLAFCNATLKGRADIQKFLHLIGIGGSGKGTFIRLLVDLVGTENTHTSTLEEWCGNRFEPAQAYKKRLVIFPDEDKGARSLGKFKQLTGGDWLRGEEKNKKPFKFKFEGMAAVASNFPIFGGDSSSGIARRLISVPFNAVVSQARRCDLNEKFQSELAAFTSYLLKLEDVWVEKILRGVLDVPEIEQQFWENKIREDSVAGFLNDKIIFDPMAQAAVGDSSEASGSLYAAYYAYCQAQGHKPQAVKNFSPNLLETAAVILSQPVEKIHTKVGKVIKGIRLREPGSDDYIPTYDYELNSRCENSGDGFGDGSVTDSVKGQDVDSVSISALVTDKTPICCEILEKKSELAESASQNSGRNVGVYLSPVIEPITGKDSDPSPLPFTDPSPDPSPLKPGDRAIVSEKYPVPDRRGQKVRILGEVFFDDRSDRNDYRVNARGPEDKVEVTLPVAMLSLLPLPKFDVGQQVKVCSDYNIGRHQFQGQSGTVTHVLGFDRYTIRFERRVNLGNSTTKDSMDFSADWLEQI